MARQAKIDTYTDEELEKIVQESSTLQEVVEKIGYSYASGASRSMVKLKLEKKGISLKHLERKAGGGITRNEENIFIENSTASQATLRRWYIKGNYMPYVCAICGQEPFWNNKKLTLTLDHINGNNRDDRLENLRWVCPNCDRQLDTFGSKNQRQFNKGN